MNELAALLDALDPDGDPELRLTWRDHRFVIHSGAGDREVHVDHGGRVVTCVYTRGARSERAPDRISLTQVSAAAAAQHVRAFLR